MITKGALQYADNARVAEKYEWARRYYKAVIAEYPAVRLQPLVMKIDGQYLALDDIPELRGS